jgi:hypothetical protein
MYMDIHIATPERKIRKQRRTGSLTDRQTVGNKLEASAEGKSNILSDGWARDKERKKERKRVKKERLTYITVFKVR